MNQILEGVRVLDWTVQIAGPCAGAILGDNGADVIHIEDIRHGDPLRGITAFAGTDVLLPNGKEAFFEDVNRNKRGIALDLRQPEGRQLMYELVAKSDVFISNYRLKARQQAGLDYQSLRRYNPRIVYGNASAFGERGELTNSPGLEMVGYATSGAMMAAGDEGAPPTYLVGGMGDCIAGTFLAYGVMAALYHRERTGLGQEVNTSMLGAMIGAQRSVTSIYLFTGNEVARHNRQKEGNPFYNWYRCKDGRWLAFGDNRPVWPVLCKGLELDWLEHDPRFDDDEKRRENCETLIAIIDEQVAKRSFDEWESRLHAAGDIILARINTIADVPRDSNIAANEYIVDWDRPDIGKVKAVGFPVSWSETPAKLNRIAPQIGEHTEEVLSEVLGYSWDVIAALKDKRVIL